VDIGGDEEVRDAFLPSFGVTVIELPLPVTPVWMSPLPMIFVAIVSAGLVA
jgi:hypothetical protein